MGLVLLIIATLGLIQLAQAHLRTRFLNAETADTLRESSRMVLCSYVATAAIGLLLVPLSLAGLDGMLPPAAVLTGALTLLVVIVVLSIARREPARVALQSVFVTGTAFLQLRSVSRRRDHTAGAGVEPFDDALVPQRAGELVHARHTGFARGT